MLVRELKNLLNNSSMQEANLNVKIVRSGGHKVTLRDILDAINSINARIDNLVAKNHLKE